MSNNIRLACFDQFTFDLATLELTQDGHPVPLPPQPARVLSLLVQNAGRLVTRDQLRASLWPDSIVDYEKGLNTAVRQVRDALGEHANAPVLIETLPRRGYRFRAEVTAYDSLPAPPLLTTSIPSPQEPASDSPDTLSEKRALVTSNSTAQPKINKRMWMAGLVTLFAFTIGVPPFFAGDDPQTIRMLVLPFANLTADPENELVVAGLTEDVRTHLSTIAPDQLIVLARTTAERYGSGAVDLPRINDELDVDVVIEGSALTGENGIRVVARLVAAEDQRPLWQGEFYESLSEPRSWRQDISEAVARSLDIERAPNVHKPDDAIDSPLGRLAYLKARYHLGMVGREAAAQAAHNFAKTLETDSSFAPALSGLAEAQLRLGNLDAARSAALEALQRDSQRGEAHRVLGAVTLVGDRDLAASRHHFEQAVAASPTFPEDHQAYAFYLFLVGKPKAGLKQAQTAYELDPLSSTLNGDIGIYYLWAGDAEKAFERCDLAAELDPEHVWAYRCIVNALEMMARENEALPYLRRLMVLEGADSTELQSVATQDNATDALSAYRQWRIDYFEQQTNQTSAERLQLARLYAAVGQIERAITSLETAASDPPLSFPAVSVDPVFRSLEGHPRFRRLLDDLWLG